MCLPTFYNVTFQHFLFLQITQWFGLECINNIYTRKYVSRQLRDMEVKEVPCIQCSSCQLLHVHTCLCAFWVTAGKEWLIICTLYGIPLSFCTDTHTHTRTHTHAHTHTHTHGYMPCLWMVQTFHRSLKSDGGKSIGFFVSIFFF